MNRLRIRWLCLTALAVTLGAQQKPSVSGSGQLTPAPRIWSEEKLRDWFIPVAGINAPPNHYSETEFYAAPIDNLRSYPVYHPDREPRGYLESLRKRGAEPMLELGKARTREGWIEAGRRVFDEQDVFQVRTSDFRIVDYVRSREALKKYPPRMTKDGQLFDFRWVVEKSGEIKLSVRECSACHTLIRPDGTMITGAQGNPASTSLTNCPQGGCTVFAPAANFIFSVFSIPTAPGEAPGSPAEGAYAAFGVPWIKDDIHSRIKSMSPDEVQALADADLPETFARFNGSPYFTTKMPSLIGVHRSRYLDHTGTHRNRGPEDIARYAALVLLADDGSIGDYKFFTDYQRKLQARVSDDALYALGMFITYGLQEPDNPHRPDELSKRGAAVFQRTGCQACHTPPDFTNGMLIPVDGFTPPESTAGTLQVMRGMRIGTDPGLALRTRKGTGYYKVPSLRGVWYRRLLEHSGSISSLEEWFDRKRLRDDYVPSGWKGPGVTHRAVPGHEFGLDLSQDDKRALIAYLKTL
jgi:hypothetical protein